MSLHFIFGKAGSGKSSRCCREIQEYLRSTPGGKAYLLVPDQGTYTAEYMLAKSFPGEGFVDVTVCGFSRLAYRVFQELHSPVTDALSPLGQQIIIRRLLEEHKDDLQVIFRAASYPHFSENLTNFFHQLDMFCVTEKDLADAAEREGDTPLGKKTADLALLYRAYHDYLRAHFSYEGSLFDLLAREIPKSPSIKNSHVWIDGFNGMAPQKIHIVSALIHTAKEVTMTLPMDRPEAAAGNPNFARPYQLYRQLQEAERHSDGIVLSEEKRFRSEKLLALSRSFFAERSLPCEVQEETISPAKGIHLLTAASQEDEVDGIARTISALVKGHGLRYRDILVLMRTPENYNDIFARACKTYEIPAFIDKKQPMNNHPLVMLTDFLVRFLTAEATRKNGGYQAEALFRLLKTGLLSDFTREEIDELENYVLTHHIRPWQWHRTWDFRIYWDLEKDPPPLSEAELAELRQVNEWRMRLLSLLDPLAEAWKNAASVKARCELLYRFLLKEKIPKTLSDMDEAQFLTTNLRPHLQVWKKILGLLDEIVHVSEGEAMDEKTFLSLFEDGLSALTYSTIPPTLDHVTITGMDRGYAMEAKVVFIPGVIEGEFPKRIEEAGFFTEIEKEQLAKSSQLLFGNNLMQMIQQEQFYVYLAMTRGSDALYLSMPASNDEGQDTFPSFLVSQMEKLGYLSEKKEILPPSPHRGDASYFANPAQALSLLPLVLREGMPEASSPWAALTAWALSQKGGKEMLHEKLHCFSYTNEAKPLPKALAEKLFKPSGRFFASVTRLEKYRACPYKYFLEYGLHLEERDDGTINTMDFGNYLHAGLCRFGNTLTRGQKQWRDASDGDIAHLSKSIASEIAPRIKFGALAADAASRYTERALNKTFAETLKRLRDWSRRSHFDTKELEKSFLLHLEDQSGGTFTLNGKIDRLDMDGDNAAIFDYKTGKTTASLKEIVSGVKLQLLTYLLAVMEENKNHPLLPTALMYLYLSGDVKSISAVPPGGEPPLSAKDNASGFLLSDKEKIRALDEKAGSPESLLPVSFTESDALRSSNSLLNETQFQNLLETVKGKLISLMNRMMEGDIAIRPYKLGAKKGCDYCPYSAICRFDPAMKDESYDYVKAPSDGEIKKMLEVGPILEEQG